MKKNQFFHLYDVAGGQKYETFYCFLFDAFSLVSSILLLQGCQPEGRHPGADADTPAHVPDHPLTITT